MSLKHSAACDGRRILHSKDGVGEVGSGIGRGHFLVPWEYLGVQVKGTGDSSGRGLGATVEKGKEMT